MKSKSDSGGVLIVEDEPEILSILTELLERRGIDVVACDNGETALQIAKKRQFSTILTDFKMPGIDGFQFVESLKEFIPLSRLIVMSGYGKQVSDDLAKIGIENYLVKPIDFDHLLKMIDKYS